MPSRRRTASADLSSAPTSSAFGDERVPFILSGQNDNAPKTTTRDYGSVRGQAEGSVSIDIASSSTAPSPASSAPPKAPSRHQSFSRSDVGRGLTVPSLTFGLVNSIMCVPVLYGYASIIFRSSVYAPYMPSLSKLCLLSSVVHQVVFSSMSTLPFAIGQVQDAGLLFLSKMADIIAEEVENDPDGTPMEAVATAIVLLGICTAMTGLALVVMGKVRVFSLPSALLRRLTAFRVLMSKIPTLSKPQPCLNPKPLFFSSSSRA